MANVNLPNGFQPVLPTNISQPKITEYVVAASQTIAKGDAVILHTDGTVIVATATSSGLLGVAASACASATAGDKIYVYDDPEQIFEAQVAGAIGRTSIYTTATSSACYDLVATTGGMYVNDSGTTYDIFKIVGFPDRNYFNKNAVNDLDSAYPRAYVKINKHLLRPGQI